MIYSPENKSDDGSHDSNSVDLQLFSDDEDDQSFFEIAIHKTQHKLQGLDDDEEQIELRISFSSSFVTSSVLWPDANKTRGRRDLLVVDIDGDRRECPFSGDFSSSSFFSCSSASPEPDVVGKTTTFQRRVTDNNALALPSSATCLDSNRDLTRASCPRKPPEKMTSPTASNGSGILNFLIKFPAAIKLQKLLASFAKATANSTPPHDPKALGTKTTSSQATRRLHKFLNKWIVPIRTELGLKNMKSYCSFDDDQYKMDRAIIITSNEKNVKKPMKTKAKRRGGFSNPNSIMSSPVINGQDHDHHQQSSIQAAIAHCRRSSTPDFCFSTPRDHHRPF